MKLYIHCQLTNKFYGLHIKSVARHLIPTRFCKINKDNCELRMDKDNRVTLDSASIEVDDSNFERELVRSVRWTADDQWGLSTPTNNYYDDNN